MIVDKIKFALIVSGSRDYTDYDSFVQTMDKLLTIVKTKYDITIIEGAARGADEMAQCYAKLRGYSHISVPADWKTHGRSAGPKRNIQMLRIAETFPKHALVAFPSNRSIGTRHMIKVAERAGFATRIKEI